MITVADAFTAQIVDLLGVEYETVPRTRSVTMAASKLGETEGDILDDDNADPDLQVEYLAKIVGLRLKPVDDTAQSASERLRELWKDDKLTLDQLLKLIEELSVAEANPTV